MQTERRQITKQRIRDWVLQVSKATGKKPTPLAEFCGLHPSTLLRAIDMEDPALLSTDSIDKIVRATGHPPPKLEGEDAGGYRGFAEPGLTLLGPADEGEGGAEDPYANRFRWQVNDRALELAGYLPGDVIWTDKLLAKDVKPGDVVIAQSVDHNLGSAETVLRRFEPPFFLTVATADQSIKTAPLLIDQRSVTIDSVVYRVERMRKAS